MNGGGEIDRGHPRSRDRGDHTRKRKPVDIQEEERQQQPTEEGRDISVLTRKRVVRYFDDTPHNMHEAHFHYCNALLYCPDHQPCLPPYPLNAQDPFMIDLPIDLFSGVLNSTLGPTRYTALHSTVTWPMHVFAPIHALNICTFMILPSPPPSLLPPARCNKDIYITILIYYSDIYSAISKKQVKQA